MPKSLNEIADNWLQAVQEKNAAKVTSMLSPSIYVAPPFLEYEVRGIESVLKTFSAFEQATEIFEYGRRWFDGNTILLEFTALIDDKDIHGIDIITTNENGKITRFDILARPATNILKLGAAIQQRLETN